MRQYVLLSPFLNLEGLSKEQLRSVLTHARRHSERDWLMMLVHFWHGARASEVIHLTPDNVQGEYLVFDRLKGSEACKQKLVEHPDELLSERKPLIEWAQKTPRNQRLFKMHRQHYWRIVRRHCVAAGVPLHIARTTVLKHTLGSLLIENMPINKVQRRMGHKNISSTAAYMKVSESVVDDAVVKSSSL